VAKQAAAQTSETAAHDRPAVRERGRPRLKIDMEAVTAAASEIFAESGYEAVSIESVSARLNVSRATLYRTVPTKDALLGVVFEKNLTELYREAELATNVHQEPKCALRNLIRVHVAAAVRMGPFMTVFSSPTSAGGDSSQWREWSHSYETIWLTAVTRAMDAGALPVADVRVTTRLILGMLIWVSRWYRPGPGATGDDIADIAIGLVLKD
jgi:AcrR family transcriptional regulator